jgi:photosystem II stability/assembly factor-like uncharacterized protein
MKKIISFLFLLSLLISNTCYSQSGWFELNSGIANDLYCIHFVNSNTGWVAAGSQILKTTSGGINWTIQNIGGNIRSLSFVNLNTGYCCGGGVYKTTNGGTNWMPLNITGTLGYYTVFFLDSNNGFIGGAGSQSGLFAKTTNGGVNWDYLFSVDLIGSLFFTNINTGFSSVMTSMQGIIYILKTTNGGVNWAYNYSWSYPAALQPSIFFTNDSTGFASGYVDNNGYHAAIIKTINKGYSWVRKFYARGTLSSIFFVNQNVGYSVGIDSGYSPGLIVKSTNSGENWFKQLCPTTLNLRSVFFVNENVGYACGNSGVIIKTTDGGGPPLGIEQKTNEIPQSSSLSQNYPNPFNPVTRIKFSLPVPSKGGAWKNVRLVIYDILGREVATVIPPPGGGQEGLKPGSYEVTWDGSRYASGVYFYKLVTDEYVETKKMVLIK